MAGDRGKRIDPNARSEFYRRAREVLARRRPRAPPRAARGGRGRGGRGSSRRVRRALRRRDRGVPRRRGHARARRGARPPGAVGAAARVRRRARSSRRRSRSSRRSRPGRSSSRAYTRMAGHLYVSGENEARSAWAEKALALAERARRGGRGGARAAVPRRGARAASATRAGSTTSARRCGGASTSGSATEVATTYNNLAYELWFWEGPAAALPVWEEMSAFCRVARVRHAGDVGARAGKLESLFDVGAVGRRARDADRDARMGPRARPDARERHRDSVPSVGAAAAWRSRRRRARRSPSSSRSAREIATPSSSRPALVLAAEVALARGDRGDGRSVLDEFEALTARRARVPRLFLPVAVRILVRTRRGRARGRARRRGRLARRRDGSGCRW